MADGAWSYSDLLCCETDLWLLELLTRLVDCVERILEAGNRTIIVVLKLNNLKMLFLSKSDHYVMGNQSSSITTLKTTRQKKTFFNCNAGQ